MNIDYADVRTVPVPWWGADAEFYRRMMKIYASEALRLQSIGDLAERFGETRESRANKLVCAARARYLWRLMRHMRTAWKRAELINFVIRIKLWVLASATRKAKIRQLIGKPTLRRWYIRLALRLSAFAKTPENPSTPPSSQHQAGADSGISRQPQDSQYTDNVRNWYGLTPLKSLANVAFVTNKNSKATHKPARSRAFPVVLFFPWELYAESDWADTQADFCLLSERPDGQGIIVRAPRNPADEAAKHKRRVRMMKASLQERAKDPDEIERKKRLARRARILGSTGPPANI